MATSRTQPIIRHLRRACCPEAAGPSDEQLLCRFVRTRDEEAFEALVRRHGPMVLGVCRRVLGDPHDADDAFQATFLVLATKAASVAPAAMLPGWLYGVARQTAVRARSASARRRRRERQLPQMPEPQAAADLPDDLRPLLDEELARLPSKYRQAVVLCDLEGRSHKEAAHLLGWPLGTVASRHSRGRRMLKERLARRGVGLPGVALAALRSQEVVSLSLLSSTVHAGSLYGAGQAVAAGAISLEVAALTEGVLHAMLLNKIKTFAAVLLVLGVVALGGGLLARRATADEPEVPQARQPAPAEAVRGGKKVVAAPGPKERRNRLEVQAEGKQVRVRALFGAEELLAVADRLSYEEGGLLILEGNASVNRRRGEDAETIQGQKVVIDPRAGKVNVEGGFGVRPAIPALRPVPVALDFGFPVAGKPAEADVPALKKELDELREKVKKLEERCIDAQAAAKDFEVAEFYRRTGHPGSAYFYFELVSRRHPGTPYADKAKLRMAEIKKQTGQ